MIPKSVKISSIKFIFLLLLFFCQQTYSQLSDFTLNVNHTNQTCTGNGSLTFNVSNVTPGAIILYSVYLLPNTTTPFAVLSGNTITGLNSGTYRVIAVQSLGDLNNDQPVDVVILDQIINLIYTAQVTNVPPCETTGSIKIIASQGNPVSYEIIDGPILAPLQSSNIFNGLTAGQYVVRVYDACGEGVVQTITLLQANPIPNLTLHEIKLECLLVDCNNASGNFLIEATNASIHYPLTIEITVFPPNNGTPIIVNQLVTSGDSQQQTINITNMPFFEDLAYNYNIKIIDGCGSIYNLIDNPIREKIKLFLEDPINCIKEISIGSCFFLPPVTVDFISSPAGFNPTAFNSSHPINSFYYGSTENNELPSGEYVIKITDACGKSIQKSISIDFLGTNYNVTPVEDPCSNLSYINIPSTLGGLTILTAIVESGPVEFGFPYPYDATPIIVNGNLRIPVPAGIYHITGIDICGRPYTFNIEVIPVNLIQISASATPQSDCNLVNGSISVNSANDVPLVSVTITEAPVEFNLTFNLTLPYTYIMANEPSLSQLNIYNTPIGSYTLLVTDICGNNFDFIVKVGLEIPSAVTGGNIKGCEIGFSSFEIVSQVGTITSVIMMTAPPTFTIPLPLDVSSNIVDGKYFSGSLPEGQYTFLHTNSCGVSGTKIYDNIGFEVLENTIELVPNCGSYNLFVNYKTNESRNLFIWLQRYNPITNMWEHPNTGMPYDEGTTLTYFNALALTNFAFNYNITSTGTFRIIKSQFILSTTNPYCISVLKEFEFNGELKIVSANTIQCNNTDSVVSIIATGIAPFTYRITTKNGQPFVVENGSSNNFAGLTPGIYNFQVKDICGNIANRLFDITTLLEPAITTNNLCEGQIGQLIVQPISFLNYQWWKGTDTTTILSTSNVLTFNPFSQSTNPGTYYVRIYSTSTLSCIDKTISFTIPNISNPNAGQDGNKTICENTSPINLFPLLVGNYDSYGVWEEITNSNNLNGNIWTPVSGLYGEFKFKYHVNGFCNDFDESFVTINYYPNPATPVITMNQEYCLGERIDFNVDTIPNADYQWSGPNNFSSTIQNPFIENCTSLNSGDYTLKIIVDDCESSANIPIIIKSTPNFTIDAACVFGTYQLSVTPIDNTFALENATYSWTGPNLFTNSSNPVNITKLATGQYNVVVTNNGCSSVSKSIQVDATLCTIPLGISPGTDGNNDEFDLSGFGDILKFKIFNRYGMVVFEQNGYTNQWHGQDYKGRELPDATYYYYIKFKTNEEKTGWVYVTRP